MLVLSRHRDECIMIGADIKVVVVDIRGDKVRLGIEAPPSVSVHRREIFDQIAAKGREGELSEKVRAESRTMKGEAKDAETTT